ncbi:MAG: alkaline phosphatase [bacterium]|nr:alkaline phosphatase [bacterium]
MTLQRALLLFALPALASAQDAAAPKNLVIMIADGFGPSSLTMARDASEEPLALDALLVGNCSTRSSDSLVTDSAASATAYAAGLRSYNGAIAVDDDRRPVGTILEAAELRGMATGLVTTTTLAHATPACFSAHVPQRAMTHLIADQQLRQGIEVLLGGGANDFLPMDGGGKRADKRDLFGEATAAGYHVVRNRAGFDAAHATPLLGIFTPGHLSYEIDRDPAREPSLEEMSMRALELIADDPEGFLLVIEGGRIDHAAHQNDPAAHLRDIYAYDKTVASVVAFARERGDTLVVSLADHATGGMTLGRQIGERGVYEWRPDLVNAVLASASPLAHKLLGAEDWKNELQTWAGIDDLTEPEIAEFDAAFGPPERTRHARLVQVVKETISTRAVIGWTTTGHNAVDVHVFAFGPGLEAFRGHNRNDEIGRILARLMRLEYPTPTVYVRPEEEEPVKQSGQR